MALSGIRITDLPLDDSLIASTDIFFKVKNVNGVPTSFQMDGSVFQNSFYGITGVNSLGGGTPFYSSVTPDGKGLSFNTVTGGTGIAVTQNADLITVQVAGTNFITPAMLQNNSIDSSKIIHGGISNQSLATNSVQYSNLYNNSSYQGVQQRLSKMWVNFDGTTGGSGYIQNIRSSFNVANIVRFGVGKYSINFSTPMSDQYYAVIGNANDPGGIATVTVNAQTQSYCQIQVDRTSPLETYDVSNISLIIFGN